MGRCLLWLMSLVILGGLSLPARASPRAPETDATLHLPLLYHQPRPLAYRLGYGVTTDELTNRAAAMALNAGWYVDWRVNTAPARPAGMDYMPVVRVHQTLSCGVRYHADRSACPYAQPLRYDVWPDPTVIAEVARTHTGLLWLIGNEIDRKDWAECRQWRGQFCEQVQHNGQDEILPTTYAVAFHELSALIRQADPTARIAIGGVVQPTPLRLAYLSEVWEQYEALYGEPMAVDVWNVHNFILQELAGSWGAEIPPGSSATRGEYLGRPGSHLNLTIFADQIYAFRRWLKERDQQAKPLIVSEYGVLYPNATMGLATDDPTSVLDFMTATFDFFLQTRDCDLGYLPDDCRLVQRWNWFSLDDPSPELNPYSRLLEGSTGELTVTGRHFQAYTETNLTQLTRAGQWQ